MGKWKKGLIVDENDKQISSLSPPLLCHIP